MLYHQLIYKTLRHVGIPVIAYGGASDLHAHEGRLLTTRVSALACGSLFNFGDNRPLRGNYDIAFKVI